MVGDSLLMGALFPIGHGPFSTPIAKHPPGHFEMRQLFTPKCVLAVGIVLCVAACSNPYDPTQRAVGGGLLGAGAGAAIGGLAGGGRGALVGGLAGGALGAVGGAATTPQAGRYNRY
jgi:hypothetical protein